jgi:hypothetical protein
MAPLKSLGINQPHDMISLDYYTIEELLTDGERAARDLARRFVHAEVLSEVVPCHRAAKFPTDSAHGAVRYAPYRQPHWQPMPLLTVPITPQARVSVSVAARHLRRCSGRD